MLTGCQRGKFLYELIEMEERISFEFMSQDTICNDVVVSGDVAGGDPHGIV
jgi:hypothetical protein